MDVGSSVSRRTRGSEAAYFRSLHAMKRKPDRRPRNIDGGCTIKNLEDVQHSETDTDDSDAEKKRKYVLKKKGPRKVGKKRARGEIDFTRLFEAGFRCKGEDLVRESPVTVVVRESGLPLKFKFKEEDDGKEKSEFEMEIDRLFEDLEVGLWESESGQTADSCVTDDEQTDLAAARWECEHEHILDEQIGIHCRFCHALLLDIKYVLPPFVAEEAERSREWNKLKNDDEHYQFQFNSCCGDLESSSIPLKGRGTVFDLIPSSDKALYPHQLEGFELIWRNIAGDIDMKNLESLPSKGGQGCIISHAPGTGKTRLTIVFLQTFLRLYPGCRPVIIAPRGILPTWEQELNKWDSGIEFHNLNDTKLSDEENAVAAELGGGQHMGKGKGADYIRFVKLVCWMKGGSILGVGYRLFEELTHEHQHKKVVFKKILLESPNLLVLDEGHTPRNDKSLMWEALTKVATQRRIILSGTPFQNNLDELRNTLSLVNPNLAKSIPRNNSPTDGEIKKLRSMIQPFVHIHKATVTLPGIRHCLIMLKPTDLQMKLLAHSPKLPYLKQDYLASLISLHPSLVSEKEEFQHHRTKLTSLQLDPNAGVKTQFLVKLIHLSSRLHERVLIFSEFLEPLRHLQKLLKSHFRWSGGQEVMYIDGDLSMKERQRLITSFNDRNSEAKVMLASQRACCEGISLVGASRVIFIDVSWNPSVQRQAICRAYRLGQQKMVYVYHLVTLMELKKYAAQAEKDRISDLIFTPGLNSPCDEPCVSEEDKVLEAMLDHTMIQRIIHQPKGSDFMKDFGFL